MCIGNCNIRSISPAAKVGWSDQLTEKLLTKALYSEVERVALLRVTSLDPAVSPTSVQEPTVIAMSIKSGAN